jgi:hypothetical protein
MIGGPIRVSFVKLQGRNISLAELAVGLVWILHRLLDRLLQQFASLAPLAQFRTHVVEGFRQSLGRQALK